MKLNFNFGGILIMNVFTSYFKNERLDLWMRDNILTSKISAIAWPYAHQFLDSGRISEYLTDNTRYLNKFIKKL